MCVRLTPLDQNFSHNKLANALFVSLPKRAFLLSIKEKLFGMSFKALANCGVYSAINSVGILMLLIALIHLPASVQYPLVTGGTMLFSLFISLLRHEKVTMRNFLGTALAIISTVIIIL